MGQCHGQEEGPSCIHRVPPHFSPVLSEPPGCISRLKREGFFGREWNQTQSGVRWTRTGDGLARVALRDAGRPKGRGFEELGSCLGGGFFQQDSL